MSAHLEILAASAEGPARERPLLFVHGAYSGAWQWQPYYLPWFSAQGWQVSAFSFRGHGASEGRERLDTLSLQDYVNDLAGIIAAMPVAPLVVAHSMGGLVLQKYLEHHELPGAVLLSSVPPHGLMAATMNLALTRPDVLVDLNRIIGGASPAVSSVRHALFHQPVSDEILALCFARMQPESMRAVWDMCGFDLPRPGRMHKPPLLILGASHDALIPPHLVELTGSALHLPVEILPESGHAMMLEPTWQHSAERIHAWLAELAPLARAPAAPRRRRA
ncbi:MAG: alpha/beta hydrolase [Candidatus Dactylopiibacterium carminicum]|uniref:Alpha/beta hydrolase n=1 Tax=Candidatus Dactylopiibacterium carminicum TaxID=857335 RepID=A0A272EVL3_9RHOO|nr:alpha/beta fold hydrolase [Candidatus Dactylopiibacterium carminicum]KAF7599917.1 alpha/beta hydrolase [Candidatus Dactylopiibacterium carminicum]PAS94145.1 MAG: alpha/beta hydrolase [Candidatus Dactylopiibacterium carminicum]PAS96786.1 MAG: alpha/beta hydrolase [Candidatus Dactylopiibacterium carminicum]PAS99918.1 MAG: hypothetical protein BSR46_05600 [Candidatus Dactylopiibacterium carminicum]